MSKYESPRYQVIRSEKPFEIRKYQTYYTTSVQESRLSGYSGFGLLFSYISGNNVRQEKLSMTVPVINDFVEDSMTMEFVVPSKFEGDIPEPNDKSLKTKHYPGHFAACITFSGTTGSKRVGNKRKQLEAWLASRSLKATSAFRLARYNPPFSLPFLRKNEIIIQIDFESE